MQAYRWVAGQVRSLPHPQAVLAQMFDEPVSRLFGPPYGAGALRASRLHNGVVTVRGSARTDREGQVITVSADKARDFLTRIEATNVGAETVDRFFDDLRRLVVAYLQQPLPTLLGDLVDTQDRAFALLEGRQRPDQTRDLYLVAGITCGLMAMASRDLGAAPSPTPAATSSTWPAPSKPSPPNAWPCRTDQAHPDRWSAGRHGTLVGHPDHAVVVYRLREQAQVAFSGAGIA